MKKTIKNKVVMRIIIKNYVGDGRVKLKPPAVIFGLWTKYQPKMKMLYITLI
ncbi:Uncharacterized protein dnm_051690 [Desulfonema magnum]|uniref:Uncharacterized protein n=1 Tax=Desulfonema magnum TaxID=45655 RepID=A0A975BP88_9BACT|nr:Uncharacterized protein dnm_051690 [Desulfonema magnum]